MVFIGLMPTAQAKDVLYSCPDINNTSKQTLGQIYQGYDGWFFKDIDFKQNYLLSPETLSYMKRFNDALREKEIELIFLPLVSKAIMGYDKITPDDIQSLDYNYDEVVNSYTQFVDQLKNNGIKVPDVLTPIKNYNQNNLDDLIFKIDHHWTPEGAMQTAEVIADMIKQGANYTSYPKIETQFKKLPDPLVVPSTMQVEAQNLCADKIPSEQLNIYDFEVIAEKTEDALFGDSDTPAPIALIGTSFSSVNNFKFRDFLENKSNLETVNHSIPGGELYISVISYLTSPFFTQDKPQYIIWESPSKYNYNDAPAPFFRQMIPAVYGDCSGDKIIATNQIKLGGKGTESLFNDLDDKKLTGNQYYLRLETTNPIFTKFTLNIDYNDGDGEWFNMDQSGRYKNNGLFYIELSDDIETNLSSITIDNIDMITTQLNAKICSK